MGRLGLGEFVNLMARLTIKKISQPNPTYQPLKTYQTQRVIVNWIRLTANHCKSPIFGSIQLSSMPTYSQED